VNTGGTIVKEEKRERWLPLPSDTSGGEGGSHHTAQAEDVSGKGASQDGGAHAGRGRNEACVDL